MGWLRALKPLALPVTAMGGLSIGFNFYMNARDRKRKEMFEKELELEKKERYDYLSQPIDTDRFEPEASPRLVELLRKVTEEKPGEVPISAERWEVQQSMINELGARLDELKTWHENRGAGDGGNAGSFAFPAAITTTASAAE